MSRRALAGLAAVCAVCVSVGEAQAASSETLLASDDFSIATAPGRGLGQAWGLAGSWYANRARAITDSNGHLAAQLLRHTCDDCRVQARLVGFGVPETALFLRATASGDRYDLVLLGNGKLRLRRWHGAVATTLGEAASGVDVRDWATLSLSVAGKTSVHLVGTVNGVPKLSATVSGALAIAGPGAAGFSSTRAGVCFGSFRLYGTQPSPPIVPPPAPPPSPTPPPPAPPPPAPPPSSAAGWTFYGPQNGLPSQVLGASADQAGNLWVAGGEAGLFVLRAGATSFQRFTMVDGLRPYGYMADGSAPPGDKYLKILSVAGGPPGTVYVGYSGKPPAPGQLDCESNWDGPNPDPAIYKSGDADKVTLIGNGIAVVHYDIFSGPGIVKNELRGREKLCNILRIVYDPDQDAVWFGANHGFALGRATFQGAPACNGQFSCMGVYEHVHPAINAWGSNDPANTHVIFLTGDYYGVAIDPVTHDTWFGGATRSTKFHYATNGKNYWTAESLTEDAPYAANRIDLWPDKVAEPNYPRPSDRVDDFVSGIAALSDGTAWFGSFARGLAHVGANGAILGYVKDALPSANVSAVTADPSDQSVWTGFWYGGGLARLSGGSVTALYGATALGNLVQSPVSDLQIQSTPAGRRVLVAFQNGAVGVYSGK